MSTELLSKQTLKLIGPSVSWYIVYKLTSFCSEKLPTVIAETRTVEMFMRFANVFGMTINVGILSAGASNIRILFSKVSRCKA